MLHYCLTSLVLWMEICVLLMYLKNNHTYKHLDVYMCDYGFMARCGLFLVFRGKLRVRNLFQVLSYVIFFK